MKYIIKTAGIEIEIERNYFNPAQTEFRAVSVVGQTLGKKVKYVNFFRPPFGPMTNYAYLPGNSLDLTVTLYATKKGTALTFDARMEVKK